MHPWVMEGGTAAVLPLERSVVQRLQRFATYGDLKQLVLKRMSELHNGTDATERGIGIGCSKNADLK